MNERKLLELAAKAAGIDIPQKLNNWITYGEKYGFQWWNMDGTRTEKTFNPLHDDGDALRLVVKLMEFEPYKSRGKAPFISNDLAATRRAIVRAAAAIGETM